MKFIKAQFSLKYEPQIKIRRFVNEIEDLLQHHYGPPQMMPLPDQFDPAASRILLFSKNGHSSISFSQLSVDFTVNFDNEYVSDFKKTEEYIKERVGLIVNVLKKININEYYFCGITYNARLEIGTQKPTDYMKKYLGENISRDGLYEASQNIAYVKNECYFINTQVGTYKEFQAKPGIIPSLFELGDGTMVSEGVSVGLDINNRYRYVYKQKKNPIDECQNAIKEIFILMAISMNGWE